MIPRITALAAAAVLLASCTGGSGTGGTSLSANASNGRFCGYYAGSKAGSGSGAQDVVRERRCFATLPACRAWFRGVQNRAPAAFLRRPCR